MSLQMQSKYNEKSGKWDLTVEGEIDISTAPEFSTLLERIYQEKEIDILLHLDKLGYIDSTGLGVIIGAYGRMQKKQNRIILLNPKDNVKKLLSITSLDKILCSEI